ncbi:MAG: hypothetical protein Q8N16_00285 [bacterium]|nr:hypothetical protein [bacterium]
MTTKDVSEIDWSKVIGEMRDQAQDLYERMKETKDRQHAVKYWDEAKALELAAEKLAETHLHHGGGGY